MPVSFQVGFTGDGVPFLPPVVQWKMAMSPIVDLPIYSFQRCETFYFSLNHDLWEKKSRTWIAHEFSGEKPFFRLDVWSTQVLTEALEHPETPQALKEVPCLWGKWFFPVRNCVDVWEILLRGVKQATGCNIFIWGRIVQLTHNVLWTLQREECEATMMSGFKLLAGPNFDSHISSNFYHHPQIVERIKSWNNTQEWTYFRNEEACVWGGRLHPTYIAIVAFTFGVCKGHPFFPHFSYPAIGVVFFAGL